MLIKFYNYNDNFNNLNKELNNDTDLEVLLKDVTDIIRPTLTLNFNGTFDFNYCYIPKINRYYFIDKVNIFRNNIIKVELQLDVLVSYKNQILNAKANIVETDNKLYGNSYNSNNENIITRYDLLNPFNADSDILVTV